MLLCEAEIEIADTKGKKEPVFEKFLDRLFQHLNLSMEVSIHIIIFLPLDW